MGLDYGRRHSLANWAGVCSLPPNPAGSAADGVPRASRPKKRPLLRIPPSRPTAARWPSPPPSRGSANCGFARSIPLSARPLAGTEDADFPFWSPDNRFLGFFAQNKLKKVEVSGGAVRPYVMRPVEDAAVPGTVTD